MSNIRKLWAALFVSLMTIPSAYAHVASDSFLSAEDSGDAINIIWDIAVRDLDFLLELDNDFDGSITWGEIRSNQGRISAIALAGLTISRDGKDCLFSSSELELTTHNQDPYVSLRFPAVCAGEDKPIELIYDFMFDTDLSHRGIIKLLQGDQEFLAVASPKERTFLVNGKSTYQAFFGFFSSGFDHILEGYDHIVFLLVLIFSVIISSPVTATKKTTVYFETFKILSAFTVAHAITISAAQFGIIEIPAIIVESAIALSIAITAADAFVPFLDDKKWRVAFSFGLIHGLGFAGALGPLSLDGSALFIALLGFNIGIEIGQLLIATFVVAILMLGVRSSIKRQQFVSIAMVLAFFAGIGWFADRTFGVFNFI